MLRQCCSTLQVERWLSPGSDELAILDWSKYHLVLISSPVSGVDDLSWLPENRHAGVDFPLVVVLADPGQVSQAAVWAGADLSLLPDVSGDELSVRIEALLEVADTLERHPFVLPEWRMLEVLHNSENAVVFLARNRQGQQAVIKRFKFRLEAGSQVQAELVRDLQPLLALRDPGLVRLEQVGFFDGVPYLLMEYLDGYTLKYLLSEPEPLPVRLGWFREICRGLALVHAAGILHRDLKTSNIMVRSDGMPVLLDFGLESRLLSDIGFLGENEIYCTPFYVSPERIGGEPASRQSDLYALGVILYELLAGEKPFDGSDLMDILQQHIFGPVPRLPPDYESFQPLLNALLAKLPESRPEDADAVLVWLDQLMTVQ
ncbi:MAG TPA: serine/threonine-protein kinase [Thiolinea sp.]|nr:serine/threonine-protein kinase [Thiolinea sp.]